MLQMLKGSSFVQPALFHDDSLSLLDDFAIIKSFTQ
jgi:hypothetical protein